MSELALKLIEENKLTQNDFIDLGNCGFKNTIPKELLTCSWLKRINFSREYYDRENKKWIKSKNKGDSNNFEGQELFSLESLSQLQSLDLGFNKITNIWFLENLKHIEFLDISHNQIKNIWVLGTLPKITSLHLRFEKGNNIFFSQNLKNLQFLDVRYSKITNYGFLDKLPKLNYLDLSHTQTKNYNFLEKLPKLQSLNLSYNQITDHGFLEKCPELQFLNIYNNPTIDFEPLYNLNNLQTLIIDSESFNKLQFKIPFEKLSVKIKKEEDKIEINSDLIFPPLAIIQQGEKAIIAYNESLRQEVKPLNELKVLLVGDGASGKTSLVKTLKGESFNPNEEKTHGIQIQDDNIFINEEIIKVHYWDFGGQEIMHATHQFFLTKDSVYILVLDGRRDERPEYWLKHIATFGGNAPVLIVLNKSEDNRSYDIVRQDLKREYPNIKGYFKVSCNTKDGIEDFRLALQKELFDLDFRKTPFNINWNLVKNELSQMREPYISYSQYYKICKKNNVTEINQQNTLLEYLNSLGIILHFEELKHYDTQVLNPLWLTQAVYRIINSPKIADNSGEFYENELSGIINDDLYNKQEIGEDENLKEEFTYWFGKKNETSDRKKINYDISGTFSFIAKVMQQFELIYNLPKTSLYIIPDLLPIEPTSNINYEDYPLHFATDFYFLPPSLLPRFIVQTKFSLVNAIKWRTGVVLNAEGVFNAEAVIRIDKENKRLHVYVKGKQKRELLVYIRSVLHGLYVSYEGLKGQDKFTELLFLPDRPEIAVSYVEIEGLEEMNEKYYISGKTKKKYEIKELLEGVENPKYKLIYPKERAKTVKIFISYSKKKKKFREELVIKLNPLIGKENYIEVWHDENLIPSSSWNQDINEALDNSDIVVCLLSDEYLASEYCMYEFNRAIVKTKKIYPILINYCGWRDTKFNEIHGYYNALEPLAASRRPKRWEQVYDEIKKLIENIKATKK